MAKAILLACLCLAVYAQGPAPEKYHTGKLLKISNSGSTYSYKIGILENGFTGTSPNAIRVTQGSEVRFALQGNSMYIIDNDGKPQETTLLEPPSPPAPKK
jgi:hypothetical protein